VTLLVQVVGRTVRASLIDGSAVVGTIDASWVVGAGQTFVGVITELLKQTDSDKLVMPDKFAVAVREPSYTTVRIVLMTINGLAWATEQQIISLPNQYASLEPSQVATELLRSSYKVSGVVFPTYDDRIVLPTGYSDTHATPTD